MRRQINFSESAGLTIEAVQYEDDAALVTFTDGTFAVIGCERRDGELANPFENFSRQAILRMGIATDEEWQAEQERLAEERRNTNASNGSSTPNPHTHWTR